MKNLIIALVFSLLGLSQIMAQPLIDRKGTASFFSEAPLENIEATNTEVIGAIDLEKGTLAVSMLMKGFRFENSLMEEHFNENYVESDVYPKATFKGTITNFSKLDFSSKRTFEAEADGVIEIHGVKKPIKTMVTFDNNAKGLITNTKFDIAVADFGIEVPKLVIKNIAEVVEVTALFNFQK